jgi:hypothetical protein
LSLLAEYVCMYIREFSESGDDQLYTSVGRIETTLVFIHLLIQSNVVTQVSVGCAESDCSLVTIADTNVVDCVFQYTSLARVQGIRGTHNF